MPTIPSGENPSQEEVDKKSKERREKDRKALRLRRINSLKRQIGIKEKMLEVGEPLAIISSSTPPPPTSNLSPHAALLRSSAKCK